MGRDKTSRWQSAGIALCAIVVAVCALLVAQVPQHAFAAELAAANGGYAAGGFAKAAPKAQGSSGMSAQYFDDDEADIPEDAAELQLGEGSIVTAMPDEVKWFTFTPSESGLYQFYSTNAQSGDDGDDGDEGGDGGEGDDDGEEEDDDDYSSVDTFGSLYVVDGDKLSQIASNDDGGDSTNFSIKQTLTKDETYYLACSEFDDEEASYIVYVEAYEFNEYDLNEYDWSLTNREIFSKRATSLDAVLELLQPYAVSPLNEDEEIPYSDLSTATCYYEVYDEEADDYVELDVDFESPLEPGEYCIRLTGKDKYDGTVSLWFDVIDENDFSYYRCSYRTEIPAEKATSEAALVQALNIKLYDIENNLVEFVYGTDYSTIEWHEGNFSEENSSTPMESFPSEPGNYHAWLIGNNPDQRVFIKFKLYDSGDLSKLDLHFIHPAYYHDGSEVSVEKLGGVEYIVYDDANEEWTHVALTEDVDYEVTWVAFADEDDETGTVLDSAPKDIGEFYCARVTAKGETYSGTCDVSFSIVDPNDIGYYGFSGVEAIQFAGNPVTLDQLDLGAYRYDGLSAEVQFEVAGWYKVTYSGDDEEDFTLEPVEPSEVVDPGVYRVVLAGASPFEGNNWFEFEILSTNSLRFAEVLDVSWEYEYTGEPIAIEPVVKLNGATLVKGEDYELAIYYEDEDEYVTSVVDAGWYTIEINAIEGGRCEDWREIDFHVKKSGSQGPTDDDVAAADAVAALIEALPEAVASDADKAKVDAAAAAFDALTDAQRALVSDELKARLDAAVAAAAQYADQQAADRAAAGAVAALIGELPETVSSDADKDAVDAAKSAYDALTDAQKALVSDELKARLDAAVAAAAQYAAAQQAQQADQAAAGAVAALIGELPEAVASDADKDAVDAAKSAFDALTDSQRALVSDELKARLDAAVASAAQYAAQQAQQAADQAVAGEVAALIEPLPETVANDEDKAQVDAAKAAYDALTDAQRALVPSNLKDKLDAAVAAAAQYAASQQQAADQAAADAVAALIEPLPETVANDADKAKVEAAVAAYEALTDLQKKLVSEALKAKLDAAVASAQQYADAQANKDKQEAKANTMTVKAKAVKAKAKKLKKKAMKVAPAKAFAVGSPQGAVTYKLLKVKAKKKLQKQANKKIKVASDGTIKLAKKLKKGTYALTVQVSAAGNADYKPATKTVTVKVKVK